MELAKVTTKGQVTIPKVIRDLLDLKEGSKILFIQKGNEVVICNSAMLALEKIQNSFEQNGTAYPTKHKKGCAGSK